MRALSRRHPASRVMKPDASRHRLPIGSCGDNAHHIELLAQMMRAEAGLHSDQGRRHVGDEPDLEEIAETVARSPRHPPRPSGWMAFVGKTGRSHQHHILLLPPKSPELNSVENIWQFMRDNGLSNRVFSPSRWPWPWVAQTHTADSRFVGTADLLAARRFQRGDDIILHAEGPPCTDSDRFPGQRGFLLPGFQRVGRPSRRWI
jgi:transposase